MSPNQVAEVQGLYGPFTLSESVIQKIWLRQDFANTKLKTIFGKELIVEDPGRWNFQEGPDFKEARLVLDGVEVVGDVEVHINLLDWHYHQHERDTNYDRVLLHVVLYLEDDCQATKVRTSKGHTPELLHLMPLLSQDLESYAMDDALLKLEQQSELEWVAELVGLPLEKRRYLLKQQMRRRWQQKLAYAKGRLVAHGWEAACHSYALEVLGYKRNRTPMLRLAERHPLAHMLETLFEHQTSNAERRTLTADELFKEEADSWKLNGLRPANHPRKRLGQYLEVVMKQPHWPDRLMDCLQQFPVAATEFNTAAFRKAVGLPGLNKGLGKFVFDSIISEKRLNTLVVDAILPLATVAGWFDGSQYWMHWFAGDSPDALRHFLKHIGVCNRQNPLSNGLIQGALGLFLDQGSRSSHFR